MNITEIPQEEVRRMGRKRLEETFPKCDLKKKNNPINPQTRGTQWGLHWRNGKEITPTAQ